MSETFAASQEVHRVSYPYTIDQEIFIGASLSEPHINGKAVRELYMFIYIIIMVCPTVTHV